MQYAKTTYRKQLEQRRADHRLTLATLAGSGLAVGYFIAILAAPLLIPFTIALLVTAAQHI